MNYQNKVFEKIRAQLSENNDWIETIGDILNLSKSAVYKRVSGDTMLSMEDIVILMKEFDFSFDDLVFDDKPKIGFRFPQQYRKIKTFMDYVEPMKEFVLSSTSLPDLKVQYATNELHFFLYFHDRDLTYFKFYVFAKSVWDLPSYKGKDFSLADFGEWEVMKDDLNLIQKAFYGIPNVEIWNGNVLTNTLNQIKYYLYSGLFTEPNEALLLCDKLETMIDHVSDMAKLGKKYQFGRSPESGVDFEMYHNEMTHTSNILLLESPYLNQIFFAFDNPNYILSDQVNLVDYTIDWFDRIKKNALPISKSANKNRRAYFSSIQKQINITKEQIENYIRLGI